MERTAIAAKLVEAFRDGKLGHTIYLKGKPDKGCICCLPAIGQRIGYALTDRNMYVMVRVWLDNIPALDELDTVGFWIDASGHVYLDGGVIVENRSPALYASMMRGEKAIYCIETDTCIDVN
jgi:hypothetical protein